MFPDKNDKPIGENVFKQITSFWKLVFCLELSKNKPTVVLEGSYLVIDTRGFLYSYIKFGQSSIKKLCLKSSYVCPVSKHDRS